MVNFTILAGGFSTFVATYLFDSDASTLSLVKQSTTGDNPSWIALHPQNSSVLYAVNEISPVGNLQSFVMDPEGGLTLVDTVTSNGNGPTFTSVLSTGEVSAMNFGSPNSSFVATVPGDPLHFERDSPVVDFPVNGGPSNPHMSLEYNGEIFVPDLGADKIWRIVNDGAPGKFRVQGQINIDPGSGPRHIAIRDNILFTLHEKTSTLTAQQVPGAPNGTTFPLIANVTIVPSELLNNASFSGSFAAAELLISEPTDKFPNPLIYVSNRNLGPDFDVRGDSIAIFEFVNSSSTVVGSTETGNSSLTSNSRRRNHARNFSQKRQLLDGGEVQAQLPAAISLVNSVTGNLTLITQVFTGLTQIRSMALGNVENGGDEFLIAGANVDGGVKMFRRIDEGRNLQEVAVNTEVANRTSFVFL